MFLVRHIKGRMVAGRRSDRRAATSSRVVVVAVSTAALLLAACGSDGSDGAASVDEPTTTTTTTTDQAVATTALEGELIVAAASSLTEAYTEIGDRFEALNPKATVTLTFDASGALVEQIKSGAPADVFASADESNMAKLTDESLVAGDPVVFARNQLVIVTKPGNPAGIASLDDLATVDGTIALCGEDVPCGKFAKQALDRAAVTIDEGSVTRGQNVKATLAALTEGDAVAAIVYVTDAVAAGDTVDIPEADNVTATYPVGVLASAENPALARAFVELVTSDEGLSILKEYGFLPPG